MIRKEFCRKSKTSIQIVFYVNTMCQLCFYCALKSDAKKTSPWTLFSAFSLRSRQHFDSPQLRGLCGISSRVITSPLFSFHYFVSKKKCTQRRQDLERCLRLCVQFKFSMLPPKFTQISRMHFSRWEHVTRELWVKLIQGLSPLVFRIKNDFG